MAADHLSDSAGMDSGIMSLEQWHRLERRLVWVYQGNPNVPNGTSGSEGALMAWGIQAGGVTFLDQSQKIRIVAGQWVFLPDRNIHRIFDPGSKLLSIKFRLHWLDGRPLVALPRPTIARVADAPDLTVAGKLLLKQTIATLGQSGRVIQENRANIVGHLKLDQALSAWFAVYLRSVMNLGLSPMPWGAFDDRLAKAASLIAQWNWRQDFSVAAVSALVGLSPSRLSHLFTARFRISLMRYAALRRLNQSQYLLEATDRPIKTIAYELGFAQPSHFTSWFNRMAGQSPAAYRRAMRANDDTGMAV